MLRRDGEPQGVPLVSTEFNESHAAVSPDGRWIAYQSNRSGRFEIYVERFPEPGQLERVSTSGGSGPRWSTDGRELFYISQDGRQLFAVPVATGPAFNAGTPTVLFEGDYLPVLGGDWPYDVGPDGHFFMIKRPSRPDEGPAIVVVENRFEELRRLVGP